MADIATAYVTLIPSLKGAQKQIEAQLAGVNAEASGRKIGGSIGKGLLGAGAIAGAAGTVVSNAMNRISSSFGSAVARVDTINNFSKVMANLGYSAKEADDVFATLSTRLDGLPTSTDAMVSMIQQLAPITGGLKSATDVGLAFNDMLLASGASTMDQNRALLQFSQMMGQGTVDMQSWRTLQQTIPSGLNQMSEALLGAGKSSTDLYEAMKSGKITFDDFNKALLKLDSEGTGKYASFAEQAKTTTGGIGTAMDNLQNRINKAVANIIDAFGADHIAEMINAFSSTFGPLSKAIAPAFEVLGDVVYKAFSQIPTLMEGVQATMAPVMDAWNTAVPQMAAAIAPLADMFVSSGLAEGVATVATAIGDFLAGALTTAIERFSGLVPLVTNLASAAMPVLADIFGVVAQVIDYLAPGMTDLVNHLGNIAEAALELATAVMPLLGDVFNGIIDTVVSVGTAIMELPGAFASAFTAAMTAVGTFANNIATGISNAVTGAVKAVTGAVGSFTSAGLSLVQGIANGIGNGASWVISKVQEVCSNALSALKSFFGIKSPSRVMAQMGGFMMQGWANGIDGSAYLVDGAMRRASEVGLARAKSIGIPKIGAQRVGAASGASSGTNVYMTLNYSADADANQMVLDIANGLKRLNALGA